MINGSLELVQLGKPMTSQEVIDAAKKVGLQFPTKEEVSEALEKMGLQLTDNGSLPVVSIPVAPMTLADMLKQKEEEEAREALLRAARCGPFATQSDGSQADLSWLDHSWDENNRFVFCRPK